MDGRSRSYAEVQRLSWVIGQALARSGSWPGDKVACCRPTTRSRSPASRHRRAGAVWCPVNPRNEAAEHRALLHLFDCACLIFQGSFAPLVARIAPELQKVTTLVCLDQDTGAIAFGDWVDGLADRPWHAGQSTTDDRGTDGTTGSRRRCCSPGTTSRR